MPAAIPFIVAAAVPAAYATVAYIATSVLVAAYQADRASSKRRKAREAGEALARDRTITIRSAVSAHQLVVGTTRLNGVLAYAEFVGDNEEYLDTITKLSFNELASVQGVYVGDEFIAVADIASQAPTTGKYSVRSVIRETESVNSVAGVITLAHAPISTSELIVVRPVGGDSDPVPYTVTGLTGNQVTVTPADSTAMQVSYNRYGPSPLKVQWAMGAGSQASTSWAGVSTPKWTSNHRLQHCAYVRALMLIDDSVFAQGDPPVGLLATGPVGVWDPRASGGAGASINGTSNPALLAAWYRTLSKADGGMGIPSTWIDWPSVATAANVCDELISVKKLDGSGYENVKRYECHGVLQLDRPRGELLAQILQTMAGDFPFSAGLYRCYAGAHRAPAITLTDADLAVDGEPLQFAPRVSGFDNLPNVMSGRIFDKARAYVETGVPEITNASYVTSDGSEEIEEYSTPMVTDARQAQYLMGVELERRRPALTATLTVGGVGDNIALLDTFFLNLANYPTLAGRAFEVRRWTDDLRGRHQLELHEVKSSTWTLDPDKFTPVSQPAKPDLSYLWNVSAVTGISVASGATHALRMDDGTVAARALVTWSSHAQDYVRESGHIELRWRRVGDSGSWVNEAPMAGAAISALIGPLVEHAAYEVELRATVATGAFSKWSAATLHIATGAVSSRWVVHGATGMRVRGDELIKAGGGSAWDAGIYSKYPIAGACRASCVKPDTGTAVMLGLNSDPTTDANYTSIDYAIFAQVGGAIGIYLSGTLAASTGTYAAGDVFAVEYDGTAVRFWKGSTLLYQVAAEPGRTLHLDSSFFHVGSRITNVDFAALAPAQRGNLLDTGAWISGTTGNQGNSGGNRFNALGTASESAVVLGTAPDGVLRELWQATSAGDNGADGGFSTGATAVEHRRMMRFVVFVRDSVKTGTVGHDYFGPALGTSSRLALISGGGAHSGNADVANPYFLFFERLALNSALGRWYLLVGYVLPSSYGGSQLNMSGMYDCATGQKILNGYDFKWVTTAVDEALRTFLWTSSSGNQTHFWRPRLEVVDGTEPSIDELLAIAKQSLSGAGAVDFAASIGLNGQFSNWLAGNDVPDGWQQWGAGTRLKETALTRTGPNAFRVQAAAADVGATFIHIFINRPAVGSYLRVSIDMRIVTNTSGGKPGVVVRLFTNSGFTTFRETILAPPSMTTGEWQTIVKNCSVQPGEEIYRVQPYLMGSWSGLPGGHWTGDVIFDSLLMDMMSPADKDELAANAASEIVQDNHDFAGTSFGTVTARSFTYTPPRAARIEFTSALEAAGIEHDSGNKVEWRVTPSGGSTTVIGGTSGQNTARQVYPSANTYDAAAGVELTFDVRVTKSGGTINLYKSQARICATFK